jgi:PPOX class probable F420-dependent enzyme
MGVNRRAQIKMSDAEIDEFLHGRHSMSMATIGPDGRIQLVAMWYGFIDGDIGFETKAKSQKVMNLRRDNRLTVMVEDGEKYEELRGVELSGWGEVIEDPDELFKLGVSVFERYMGMALSDETRPFIETMLHKRVLVRLHTEKVVSWDHSKLGG